MFSAAAILIILCYPLLYLDYFLHISQVQFENQMTQNARFGNFTRWLTERSLLFELDLRYIVCTKPNWSMLYIGNVDDNNIVLLKQS